MWEATVSGATPAVWDEDILRADLVPQKPRPVGRDVKLRAIEVKLGVDADQLHGRVLVVRREVKATRVLYDDLRWKRLQVDVREALVVAM